MARTYDKLVRDRIPDRIEANGERPITHVADDEEYAERLAAKLCEEAAEYRESGTLEELADISAVLTAILEHRGTSREELDAVELEKRRERGGFEDRLVLERVEERDDDRETGREGSTAG